MSHRGSPYIHTHMYLLFSHSVTFNFFATQWTVAHQAPPSIDCPAPALEHRLGSCGVWVSFLRGTPGSEVEPVSPELQADSLPPSHQGRPDAFSSKTSLLLLALSPLLFLYFSVSLLHTNIHTYTFNLLVSLFFNLF